MGTSWNKIAHKSHLILVPEYNLVTIAILVAHFFHKIFFLLKKRLNSNLRKIPADNLTLFNQLFDIICKELYERERDHNEKSQKNISIPLLLITLGPVLIVKVMLASAAL